MPVHPCLVPRHGAGAEVRWFEAEPCYVYHSVNAWEEDDGWVLSYVLDDATGRSEVVVLEAADFTAPPVARVLLPARVAIDFHACWMPGAAVSDS